MTNKLMLMKADFVLQSLAIAAVIASIFLIDNRRLDDAFVFTLFILASIQVVSNLFLGFKYDDKRRKGYLKVLFWVQGVGSFIAMVFASSGLDIFGGIAFCFLYIGWILIPFFMVFWSLYNSWCGIKDAKFVIEQEIV